MKPVLVILSLALGACVVWFLAGLGASALAVVAVLAFGVLLIIGRAGEDREFLQQVFVAGLLLRVGLAAFIYMMSLQEFFGGDAYQYDYFGNELLKIWRGDSLLPASRILRQVNGYGMLYMVTGIYAAMGRNPLAIQFINALLGAATAILIYFCSQHIYQNRRVARTSALLVAFFPSMILWSAQGLKDGPIVFFLVASILMALKLGRKVRASYAIGLAAALGCLLTFRFYIFYMVAVAIAGGLLIGMRKWSGRALAQQLVLFLALGLALTYFGVLRTAQQQFDAYGSFEKLQVTRQYFADSAKSGFGKDVDVSTATGAFSAIPLGLVYLLFAPFPWQLASLRQMITLPEMLVWWTLFPLLVVGLWFTLRHRLRQALPVILFTAMLTLAYSVFQGNVGTAYRQRSQLLVFYFIFVSVGAVLLKERREDRRKQERMREEEARALRQGWRTGRDLALPRVLRHESVGRAGQTHYLDVAAREIDDLLGIRPDGTMGK